MHNEPTQPKPYKETLNLPVTKFDMKANLTVREPEIQKRWAAMGLYSKIREARSGRERRVLHDGPPYANGEIHMGHLLNKVLKDLVARSLTMRGYNSPYVPGWDCHGLPIEHKVMKDLGSKAQGMSQEKIRELCHNEALKWVGIQRDQFKRLGIEGSWEDPYLTLDPRYEAGIIDVLADLLDKGFVFRQLKPIHWCISDRTALAEAELEYHDETSPSIYVNFPMVSGVPEGWGPGPWHAMIWTTTPWTLPANVAIAAHSDFEYAGIRYRDPVSGETVQTILAVELVAKVLALRDVTEFEEVGRVRGQTLEHATYRHPFLDRESPIVLAAYVTVDGGTGLVHTAPGHGAEDYQTGRTYKLPTLSPVDASGRFTSEAPEWLTGKSIFAANPEIIAELQKSGHLFKDLSYVHSYPHCWRCKKPVIFRATEQWFIGVDRDDLRGRTLKAIDGVTWLPAWGKSRIDAMVSLRPDWCISRQRTWGVPIPALGCEACDTQLLTAETARHFRDLFREQGANAWYAKSADEIAPPGAKCPKCGGTKFRKEGDILDVWFESGSSHRAVLDEPSYGLGGSPAYIYLEGSDQHRGWFQSSILTSVGANGYAPFKTVLTHGFIVDDKGAKMSKSIGNTISAVKATEQYGADVLRLYVASMDYANDIRISEGGIKEMSEAYRKIRNTFRYMLGNLEDYAKFDPASVPMESLHEIDLWALGQLNALIRDVRSAYEVFEFYKVYQRIYQFCSVTLSSLYLDVLKDRLYAEAPLGPHRRAAQFVLAKLHDTLVKLLAPIIPHTAEELWGFLPDGPGKLESAHLAEWPEADPRWDDAERDARWEFLLDDVRETAMIAIEGMRKEKLIGSAQAAELTITAFQKDRVELLNASRELLTTLCMVADVTIVDGSADASDQKATPTVIAKKTEFERCERCWNHRASVGKSASHPTLCERCVGVIEML